MQGQQQTEESLTLYRSIRDKTKLVEEQSNKIDELYQVSFNLENQIERVGRYCIDTYGSLKVRLEDGSLSMAEVRATITEKNKELEAYPRINRNCIEYFTKYSEKHAEYTSKFAQHRKTESLISDLLE